MNTAPLIHATYQGLGEQAAAIIAAALAIATTHAVCHKLTQRYGICAPQWPAWLTLFGSFCVYAWILVCFIR